MKVYEQLEHSSIRLLTHELGECLGEHCTIHNKSNHPMRNFPQFFRFDTGIMERNCSHGVGHPDPDEYLLWKPGGWAVALHGCDGCCEGTNYPKVEENEDNGWKFKGNLNQ